jgi:hypothetical protein
VRASASPKPKATNATIATRARVDGKAGRPSDVSWHATFLDVLSKTANVAAACRAAGIACSTAYSHRERFEDFRDAWVDFERMGTEQLVALAMKHALEGTERPIYQGGVLVGTELEFDHRLLICLLEKKRPAEFGSRQEVTVRDEGITTEDFVAKMRKSPALRETVQKLLTEACASGGE